LTGLRRIEAESAVPRREKEVKNGAESLIEDSDQDDNKEGERDTHLRSEMPGRVNIRSCHAGFLVTKNSVIDEKRGGERVSSE